MLCETAGTLLLRRERSMRPIKVCGLLPRRAGTAMTDARDGLRDTALPTGVPIQRNEGRRTATLSAHLQIGKSTAPGTKAPAMAPAS